MTTADKLKKKILKIEYSDKIQKTKNLPLKKLLEVAQKAKKTFKDEDYLQPRPCLQS